MTTTTKKTARKRNTSGQLPAEKAPRKKRIVSSPRVKGEPKIGVSVRFTSAQIQKLDELREPQKLSRTLKWTPEPEQTCWQFKLHLTSRSWTALPRF